MTISESHCYVLTSAILKVDVVCDLQYNQCVNALLFVFYLSHGSDKGYGMLDGLRYVR